MKQLLSIILLFSVSSVSAYECQVEIAPETHYFGQCFDKKEEVVFRSCLDFNCKVPKNKAKRLKKGQSCVKALKDQKLKEIVEKEQYQKELQVCGSLI